ncbi:MAG: 50S ribosomal protein L9 [Gammaproteobacteria bacterium]|nr:MAG: 50S ribosomal protein L9 [Gammaproteobacteria bacterium]
MKVILLQKRASLGDLGTIVNVKNGYARNYLIPQSKAIIATKENMEVFEKQRAQLEREAADTLGKAQLRAREFSDQEFTITAKTATEDKLFGSIGIIDICQHIENKGLKINKKEIRMPHGPIHTTGEFEVGLHFHADVDATITIKVEAE